MSNIVPVRPSPLTHAELNAQVASLHAVGGLYVLIASIVERQNRAHCVDEGVPS